MKATAIAVSTAAPASASAGPSAASRIVASNEPTSVLVPSQDPIHRLAVVNSRVDLTTAGSDTAEAGPRKVNAAAAIAHRPTTTATGASTNAPTAAPARAIVSAA